MDRVHGMPNNQAKKRSIRIDFNTDFTLFFFGGKNQIEISCFGSAFSTVLETDLPHGPQIGDLPSFNL